MWARIKRAWGVLTPRARYILAIALLLVACVTAYWYRWRSTPLANNAAIANLPSTPTPSGVPAYIPPPIPKIPRPVKTVRPVQGTPVVNLPPAELQNVPVSIPPASVDPTDNAVRPSVLVATAVVPPHRGETDVRTYLLADGEAKTFLYPQREPFLGFDSAKVELEAGYGVGSRAVDATARWMPLRVGDFHLGAEVSGWSEQDGTLRGAASIRIRWEPFR